MNTGKINEDLLRLKDENIDLKEQIIRLKNVIKGKEKELENRLGQLKE